MHLVVSICPCVWAATRKEESLSVQGVCPCVHNLGIYADYCTEAVHWLLIVNCAGWSYCPPPWVSIECCVSINCQFVICILELSIHFLPVLCLTFHRKPRDKHSLLRSVLSQLHTYFEYLPVIKEREKMQLDIDVSLSHHLKLTTIWFQNCVYVHMGKFPNGRQTDGRGGNYRKILHFPRKSIENIYLFATVYLSTTIFTCTGQVDSQ